MRAAEGSSIQRLLAAPQVRSVAVWSILARMPFGTAAVALVIFVQSRTGSFAVAGAVTAGCSLAFAVAGPLLGRLADRRGPRFVLVPAATVSSAALLVVVALGEADAPVAALVAAGVVAGATMPPITGVLRLAWPSLVAPDDLASAYLLDSILFEVLFIGGQLLAGLLAVIVDPAAPLVFAAVCGFLGSVMFASRPEIDGGVAGPGRRHGVFGALGSPAVLLLVVTGVPIGFTFGALDVALPAFGADHGTSALGGIFTALLAVGSVIGALLYGLYGGSLGSLRRACICLAIAQPVFCLPILLATSPLLMIVPALLGGCYAAPALTVRNRIAQISMLPGTGTETFTWLVLAEVVGVSIGSLVAGPAIEHSGWRLGVAIGIALPAVALPLLIARRRLLPLG